MSRNLIPTAVMLGLLSATVSAAVIEGGPIWLGNDNSAVESLVTNVPGSTRAVTIEVLDRTGAAVLTHSDLLSAGHTTSAPLGASTGIFRCRWTVEGGIGNFKTTTCVESNGNLGSCYAAQ